MNRTARALVSLYALLCLVAGVPALHAAEVGSSERTAAVDPAQQDGRNDAPAAASQSPALPHLLGHLWPE